VCAERVKYLRFSAEPMMMMMNIIAAQMAEWVTRGNLILPLLLLLPPLMQPKTRGINQARSYRVSDTISGGRLLGTQYDPSSSYIIAHFSTWAGHLPSPFEMSLGRPPDSSIIDSSRQFPSRYILDFVWGVGVRLVVCLLLML